MTNAFDDEDGTFAVVVNQDRQHALWPSAWGAVPAGWRIVHGPADRRSCTDHVNRHWTDTRPVGRADRR